MNTTPTNDATADGLTRPIIGIENRTAQEAFDIMADRIRSRLAALASAPAGSAFADAGKPIAPVGDGYVLMPRLATRAMVDAADACTDAYSAYNAMVEAAHVR